MMKKILILVTLIVATFSISANAQTRVKGSGVVYTNGAPTHSVNLSDDAEIAIDSASGLWYEYNRDALAWAKAGFRVQHLAISVAPTGAPQDKQSEIVINDVDSLYQWRGGAWRHLNKVWDNSITNEGQIGVGAGGASSSVITSNTSGAVGVTINVAGINAITETTSANGGSITITATEVDGSVSNELQTYSHAGTTTYTNTLSNGGGSWSITGAGIAAISQTGGAITVTATEVDGSVTNEGQIGVGAGGASSSVITSNTSGAVGVTINVAGINAITETTSANGGSITITATEVDGSVTNELQTITSTSDATSHTVTLSNTGGSFKLVEGANITLTTTGTGADGIITIASTGGGGATDLTFTGTSSPVTLNSSTGTDVTFTAGGINSFSASGTNITITATEVDGSVSNELQTYSHAGTTTYTNTLSNGGGSFSITGAGINVVSQTAGAVTITATEVDGSVSNELQTYSHAGTTTYTNTLSNGGGSWSITGAGIAAISQTAGAITVTATEVDGSITNELQTITSSSDATSHTVTLSNTGGSIKLVEGANITLTTTGTGADGIVTIAATSGGGTDLTFTGTASPVTLNSSSGTDVTFTAGGINSFSASGTNITITATEVDGSTSNELQTYSHAGTTTYTNTLSNGGGSWSITGAGIAAISQTAGAITVTATEVDGSVSNELQTYSHAGTTTYTNTLSNGGGSFSITGAGINVVSQTAGAVTITATEVDGSLTNEGQIGVGAGGASSSVITSNTSGATGVTINVAGINAITETTSANGGSITITATEVDGSVTNELQTITSTSDATSHTVTLSNTGGSIKLVEGANITLTTTGTGADGIVTIDATASPLTEGQAIDITSSVVNLGAPDSTTSLVTSKRYVNFSDDAAFIQFSTSRELFDDGAAAAPVLRFINQQSGTATEGAGMTFLEKNGATLLSQSTIFNSTSGLQFQSSKSLTMFAADVITNQADSIQFQTVATSTKIPAVVGINSVGTIKQIVGTSNGQVLTWSSGGWVAGAGGGGSGDILQGGNSFTAPFVIGTNDNFSVSLEQNGTTAFTIGTDKNVTMVSAVAATNTITNRLILQTNSTGVAANNFGTGILFQAETSTTDNRDQASIGSFWASATEGAQTGALSFKLPQGGGALTEAMKLDRSGAATGMLHIGTTTPAQITNTNFYNNAAYTFGATANAVTLGGFTGTVELARTSANTSSPVDFTIDATSSGAAANGFGTSILLQAESSTTDGRDLGSIQGIWSNATDASRSADLVINLSNNATVAERTRFYAAGGFITQATGIIKGTGSATGSNTSSTLRLWNPTVTTGDTWYLNSKDNGEFGLFSGNANEVLTVQTDGTVATTYDFKIADVTGITPTTVIGRDATGNVGTVTLGSGVALAAGELPLWNSNDAGVLTLITTTALVDVTGLSFPVTNGKKYEFRAMIYYSAAATTTGSAWSINGPAGTVGLRVESGLTNNTTFNHWQNAVNTLLASASSAYTPRNVAEVSGIVEPTADGTYIIRGGTEVAASAITVQGVSNINWREIK